MTTVPLALSANGLGPEGEEIHEQPLEQPLQQPPSEPDKVKPKKRRLQDPTLFPKKEDLDPEDENNPMSIIVPQKRTLKPEANGADAFGSDHETVSQPSKKQKPGSPSPVDETNGLPNQSRSGSTTPPDESVSERGDDTTIEAASKPASQSTIASMTESTTEPAVEPMSDPTAMPTDETAKETTIEPMDATVNKPIDKIINALQQETMDRKGLSKRKKPTGIYQPRKGQDYSTENSDDEDDGSNGKKGFFISSNEKTTVVFDFSRERARRMANVVDIPEDMYTQKERSLFLQLAMRGFEPVAPKDWQFDFPTLPDSLFPATTEDESKPIIQTSRSTTFYATKSLGNLFSLSGRVRDCSILGKSPESLIKQTIKKYIRWALFDVNLEIGPGSLPVHVIHAQRQNQSIYDALQRLNSRLKKLAVRHKSALLAHSAKEGPSNSMTDQSVEPPLLLGFIVCGPIVAIMTYDMDLMKDRDTIDVDGKFISQFDLSEKGQDVWNSLSVVIAVMHVRNTMVQLSQKGYGGFLRPSIESSTPEDV